METFEVNLNSLVNKLITSLTELQSHLSDLNNKKIYLIGEIRKLRHQRELLLKQQPKIEKTYKELSDDSYRQTEDFAKQTKAKLASESARLVAEGDDLVAYSVLLTEMSDYFGTLGAILEANEAANASKKAELEKMAMDVSSKREMAEKVFNTVSASMEKAVRKEKTAGAVLKETERMRRFIQGEALDIKAGLDRREKELKLREKTVAAKEKRFGKEKERLANLERLLKDKDRALARKYRELKVL